MGGWFTGTDLVPLEEGFGAEGGISTGWEGDLRTLNLLREDGRGDSLDNEGFSRDKMGMETVEERPCGLGSLLRRRRLPFSVFRKILDLSRAGSSSPGRRSSYCRSIEEEIKWIHDKDLSLTSLVVDEDACSISEVSEWAYKRLVK